MPIDRIEDTICAVSTPAGVGGIAVVRVSGRDAFSIVDRIWNGTKMAEAGSHTAHLGTIVGDDGEALDQCVATVFRGPKSFTGEDVVELSVHGSVWIQRQVVNRLIKCGCRLASAGEFTRRAFASGKMDLAEAEGVADLIASSSKAAHRIAMSQMRGHFSAHLSALRGRLLELASLLELELDFSEEEVEFASRDKLSSLAGDILSLTRNLADSFEAGTAIKDGIPVAIVGATNAGKSTILNQLLHEDRAIVSNIHGTTRDTIEDTVEIGGILFRIIDTAGLRRTSDEVESLGIERAMSVIDKARIVVWVVDSTDDVRNLAVWERIEKRLTASHRLVVALNKADLLHEDEVESRKRSVALLTEGYSPKIVRLTAKTGEGIDALERVLADVSGLSQLGEDDIMVTNARHFEALVRSTEALERVLTGLQDGLSGDFVAQDVRLALHYLGEITGEITTQDILATIFSRFCIGK